MVLSDTQLQAFYPLKIQYCCVTGSGLRYLAQSMAAGWGLTR